MEVFILKELNSPISDVETTQSPDPLTNQIWCLGRFLLSEVHNHASVMKKKGGGCEGRELGAERAGLHMEDDTNHLKLFRGEHPGTKQIPFVGYNRVEDVVWRCIGVKWRVRNPPSDQYDSRAESMLPSNESCSTLVRSSH